MASDPAVLPVVAGAVVGLSGVVIGGVVNFVSSFFLSKQREAQEVRAFHRQKSKEAGHRRLQNIRELYERTIDVASLTGIYSGVLLDTADPETLSKFYHDFRVVFRDFFCSIDLYFPELRPLSGKLSEHYGVLIMAKYNLGLKHEDADLEAERISMLVTQWSETADNIGLVLQEIQQALRKIVEDEGLAISLNIVGTTSAAL